MEFLSAYICGLQLLLIINASRWYLALTDRGEIIGIGCDKEHIWEEKRKQIKCEK